MFARVTTFHGPIDQIEEGVRTFRENVIPWLSDATGFRGWIVLLDREAGRSLALTFWATEQAARDQDASGATLRDEVVASMDLVMDSLSFYEVAVVEQLSLDEAAADS